MRSSEYTLKPRTRARLEKLYVDFYTKFNPERTIPLTDEDLWSIQDDSLLGLFEDLVPDEKVAHSICKFKLRCYEELEGTPEKTIKQILHGK